MVVLIVSSITFLVLALGLSILARYYLRNRSNIAWKRVEKTQRKYLEDQKKHREFEKRQWDIDFGDK